jgi:IclR family acetate operon transcriptional repressor
MAEKSLVATQSNNRYLLNSAGKILDVLDCFDDEQEVMTLTEIVHRTGLPKTSAMRLLHTLVEHDYLERYGSDGYRLQLKLFLLGSRVSGRFEIREAASEVMARLRDKCGDAVNLAVPDGNAVLYVAVRDSPSRLRMTARLGDRDPIVTTALGKAMLSCLREVSVEEALAASDLPIARRKLSDELAKAHADGFARDDGGTLHGARCLAAPIVNGGGAVLGALSISGPSARLTDDRWLEIGSLVSQAAEEVSRKMGFAGTWLPSDCALLQAGDQ